MPALPEAAVRFAPLMVAVARLSGSLRSRYGWSRPYNVALLSITAAGPGCRNTLPWYLQHRGAPKHHPIR